MNSKEMFQEIFIRIKLNGEKVHLRTFAWRELNFDKMMTKNVSLNNEADEISFTSEFNAKFSKEEIKNFIDNEFSFTTGEGISAKFLKGIEVIEIKEEAEIYSNESPL